MIGLRQLGIFVSVVLLLPLVGAWARETPPYVDVLVTSPFPPVEVYLILAHSEGILRVRAERFETSHGMRIGARMPEKLQRESLQIGVLFVGRGGQYHLDVGHVWPLDEDTVLGSIHAMRQSISAEAQARSEHETKIQHLQRQLSTLEADAEIIGEMASVRSKESEVAEIKERLAGLEKDRADMELAIQQMRSSAVPPNYARREVELTQRIRDLAEAVRVAEAGEELRRKQLESALSQNLDAVRAAEREDPDVLEAELRRLRGGAGNVGEGSSGGVSYHDIP